MATSLLEEALPQVARVGFDHGWLLLGPTFLNLGLPLLLVDHAYLGDVTDLGLEQFGTRDPRTPLPASQLTVQRSGRYIGLRDKRTPGEEPLAIGAFADPACLHWLTSAERLAVAVGGTWAAEQSWSALWRFAIGTATIQVRQPGPK